MISLVFFLHEMSKNYSLRLHCHRNLKLRENDIVDNVINDLKWILFENKNQNINIYDKRNGFLFRPLNYYYLLLLLLNKKFALIFICMFLAFFFLQKNTPTLTYNNLTLFIIKFNSIKWVKSNLLDIIGCQILTNKVLFHFLLYKLRKVFLRTYFKQYLLLLVCSFCLSNKRLCICSLYIIVSWYLSV